MAEKSSLYRLANRILFRKTTPGVYDPHLGYVIEDERGGPHPQFNEIYDLLVSETPEADLRTMLAQKYSVSRDQLDRLMDSRRKAVADG